MEPLDATDPESIGPYRLVARLGAGGMGRVYLARSAGGRTVAVKVVRPELAQDPEFRTRFRREVAAAQAVDGAYTAPVVDSDPESPTPWLATAYVLGPSLTDAVQQHGPLPEHSCRIIGARLAEALRAIHGAGLVHRDLKPSNVLLAADGPRVIDFGIARAMDGDNLTSTGVVVGSPGFMAPEQASGLAMGPAGDVFSLGSVLVYAATGHGPFDSASGAAAQLYRVVHDQPELSQLPSGLQSVIAACLTKDPARRPDPTQLAAMLLPPGAPVSGEDWLPAPVASALARHASSVMDLETPSRGTSAPQPAYTPTGVNHQPYQAPPSPYQAPPFPGNPYQAQPAPGTMQLGRAWPPNAATPSKSKVSRRALLAAGGGVAALAAAGGTAWALTRPKPKPTPGPAVKKVVSAPKPVWSYPSTDSTQAQHPALVLGNSTYLTGRGLTSLDAASGAVRWSRPDLFPSDATVGAGQLLILSRGVTSIDPATGREGFGSLVAWGSDHKVINVTKILAVDDNAVYLKVLVTPEYQTGGDQMVLALRDTMLIKAWAQPDQDDAASIATGRVTGSTLLHSSGKSGIVARDTKDGHQLWQTDTGNLDPWPIWCDDKRLYCMIEDSDLQAVGLADGKQQWRIKSTVGRFTPVLASNDVIYTSDGKEAIGAFEAATGRPIWSCPLPKQPSLTSAPVLVGSTLFVPGDYGMGVHAIDARSGVLKWTFQDDSNPGTYNDWYLSTDGNLAFARLGTITYGLQS
ncbi:serine/threonine-protein kinase [Kitasatospora sp. MAP5-34]|uniref:serine/threonine-protein kinase n=1 Tax=Kitasatospora sp. MAP5-34 TaxID=3035102 RepID=UPI002474D653|nr:serine/threonine-protein kinase [Kitasatospora sp. MAP5-34]MDH6579097.1 serine/threonine protein kinase [Kitasatospora sp. MAP5-34]